jgi:hypothetical protein
VARLTGGRAGQVGVALGAALLAAGAVAGCGTPKAADPAAAPRLGCSRVLYGASVNQETLSEESSQFGHLPIVRVYFQTTPPADAWTTGPVGLAQSAVVVSWKALPSAILSGADDASLRSFFDSAPAGHPIYYSYYHEPEDNIAEGQFTLAAYKAAWKHVVAIADAAHNPELHSTLILMSYDLNPESHRDFRDYIPSGHVISTLGWDAYPAGTVQDRDPQLTSPGDFMGPEIAASKSVGLPYGFSEFALGTADGRPGWLDEVARYLNSSNALFAIYFDSRGWPDMELTDGPSISAWRHIVATSGDRVTTSKASGGQPDCGSAV